MRKILSFTRNGTAAFTAACRRVSLVSFGASLAVTFCCSSNATAQPRSHYVVPAATMSNLDAPVSGNLPQWPGEQVTHGAEYSIISDSTQVEPARYATGGRLGTAAASNYYAPNVMSPGCDVSWYANYDALWLRRENDERFSLSRNSFMPDFQYEFGGRYTVGHLLDCVNGWEAVYTGPYDWQRQAAVLGAGNLQSRFIPSGGFTGNEVSAFNNADQHVQAWRAQLNSFELNRRWWTWDVLSTMIGVRYVDYEENYLFLSDNALAGTGLFRDRIDNRMLGVQFGADLLYPVNLRTNVGFRGKAGVYANFEDRDTLLQNAGTTVLASGDTSTDVAGVIEMGVFANYQIVPSIRLTAGYEFWYLPGVATVPEQASQNINPGTGFNVSNDDELFLHGGSVGVQILF